MTEAEAIARIQGLRADIADGAMACVWEHRRVVSNLARKLECPREEAAEVLRALCITHPKDIIDG